MTQFLLALLGVVVGLVGGYIFGVAQSRSERRDNALADIFKEMSLFYRGVVAWTADPNPNSTGPITEPDTQWPDYCRKRYEIFLHAFYGNAIWLGKETYDLIQEFADAGKDILNDFSHMRSDGSLPDGTKAWNRRAERLAPKYTNVEEALRAEIERSRSIIPYKIVVKKNASDQEGRSGRRV